MGGFQPGEPKEELKGNMLRVYWLVLNGGKGGVGPREVQRILDFSSPGSASYHLEKLVRIGLVNRDDSGHYFAAEGVKVEVFSEFVRLMGVMVPRYFLLDGFNHNTADVHHHIFHKTHTRGNSSYAPRDHRMPDPVDRDR